MAQLINRISVPVVTIDRPVFNSEVLSVVANNYKGAKMATRHLIDHGYRRIVCLTGESTLFTIRERIRGYRAAMDAAGLTVTLVSPIGDYDSAESTIKRLFSGANRPDALFTLKNSTTIFAFEALQKMKISIPDSVALLGFDAALVSCEARMNDAIDGSVSEIAENELTKDAGKTSCYCSGKKG